MQKVPGSHPKTTDQLQVITGAGGDYPAANARLAAQRCRRQFTNGSCEAYGSAMLMEYLCYAR